MPSRGTINNQAFHDVKAGVVVTESSYGYQASLVGWQAEQAEPPPFVRHPRQGRPAASKLEVYIN